MELVERIQRLERAVFPAGEAEVAHEDSPTGRMDPATSNSRLSNQDEEQQRTSQWLEGLLTTV